MNVTLPAYPYRFSKIKDIYLEIGDYSFLHSHLGQSDSEELFIGRRQAKERLKMILTHSRSRSGAYLVTGYRGMGKTSLVHEVLRELSPSNKEEVRFAKMSISLSQDDVQDMDVLRQLTQQLNTVWRGEGAKWRLLPKGYWQMWLFHPLMLIFIGTTIICLTNKISLSKNKIGEIWNNYSFSLAGLWGLLFLQLFIYLFIVLYLFRRRVRWYAKYSSILNRIEQLNKRLDAKMTREQNVTIVPEFKSDLITGSTLMKFAGIGNSKRESLSYEIASPKETEKELITILQEIDDFRQEMESPQSYHFKASKRKVPELLFIIDELDKIEPSFFNRDMAFPQDDTTLSILGINKARKRQEAVARLLSNLKSFLNEAKAKFIFIGGREMYDASLADIADRDSFYSSIFHEIIYVNSFFKDELKYHSGVTRMTEAYLCRLLIPKSYRDGFVKQEESEEDADEICNLGTLFHFLVDEATGQYGEKRKFNKALLSTEDSSDAYERKSKIYKIIFLLQNLVIFLTYRSNGTPKKLAELVEHFIMPINKSDFQYLDKHAVLMKWHEREEKEERLFLKFRYDAQYEIGLMSNLYRPYVIMHSRYLKALGDKLLYSTAFIMDYILKFHPFGFSWRNLELVPEIILVNKDPNLRTFIQELIQYLSRMHLRETINGMFQYKFLSKTSNELQHVSKISELSAAAFNFTLDESLNIKSYYQRRLDTIMRRNQEHGMVEQDNPFVHSITFLHNILGDLFYYDKEYDEAIVHYSDAIQPLRARLRDGDAHFTMHQVVLLVRTKLKLGLCYEKIRSFDYSYAIYRNLISYLPQLLEIEVVPDRHPDKSTLGQDYSEDERQDDSTDKPARRMQLFLRPYIAILDLIEKQRLDGITISNLTRNIKELDKLLGNKGKAVDVVRQYTLYSDYYSNVGSILYYKNRNFSETYTYYNAIFGDSKEKTLFDFLNRYNVDNPIDIDYNPSLNAYFYYRTAIDEQVKSFEGIISGLERSIFSTERKKEGEMIFIETGKTDNPWPDTKNNSLMRVLLLLHPKAHAFTNSSHQYIFGNLFSKIGDSLLSCTGMKAPGIKEEILRLYKEEDQDDRRKVLGDLLRYMGSIESPFDDPINYALALYRIAGYFYSRGSRQFSQAFQYKKFFFILRECLILKGSRFMHEDSKANSSEAAKVGQSKDIKKIKTTMHLAEETAEIIASRILQSISLVADVANRPQIQKYRDTFHAEIDPDLEVDTDTVLIYNNISTSAETREVILMLEEIRLRLNQVGLSDLHLKIDHIITPYNNITNKYLRLLEMRYKCEYNYALLKQLGVVDLLAIDLVKEPKSQLFEKLKEKKEKELVSYLILDSIFCLNEVIRTLNLFGINYVTNHSYLAEAHQKMANWSQAMNNFKQLSGDKEWKDMNAQLTHLVGTDIHYQLEPRYHITRAIQHYYAAVQTHNGGKAYKDNVTNMSFLEDDFNDNFSHFAAALERFRINTGSLRNKINGLRKKLKDSRVYQTHSYRGYNPAPT